MGAEIKDAESATHESDSSTYKIVDTYSFPGFKVIQFTLPVLSVYTYLLISDGEALLVDPVRDITFYLETAKKESAKIKGVYLTHSHADFIAGHTEIKKALNVPIYQSHKSGAKYSIKPVDEKSSVKIGSATLKFMDTPGHTPDGQCCAVFSKEDPEISQTSVHGRRAFCRERGSAGSHGRYGFRRLARLSHVRFLDSEAVQAA